MASFVVMEPPVAAGNRPPAYVRDGFHWLAFLFAPIWLLVHRLWIETLMVVAVMVALSALGTLAGARPAEPKCRCMRRYCTSPAAMPTPAAANP